MPSIQVPINNTLPWTQAISTNLQTVFSTNWTADDVTDVVVYYRLAGVDANDSTQIVSPNDYTVALVGSNEYVEVTFLVGRVTNSIVTIMRNTPADRLNLYINTNFAPTMLNGDFGRMVMMIQQRLLGDIQLAPKYNNSATLNPNGITDQILPVLPASRVWRKNADDSAIETAALPANPVGSVGGNFQHDQWLVRTNIDGGANDIEEMPIVLRDDLIMISVGASWGLDSADDLSLDAAGDLIFKGQVWPETIGAEGTVIGVASGILAYLNVPTVPGITTAGVIPKFSNTIGGIADSQFYEDGTDLMLPAGPTQNLAAATKQYVDDNSGSPFMVLQDGSPVYGVDGGATDSYAITLIPAPLIYVDGMTIRFKANTQNTTDATLNVNGLGAIPILKFHDQALATGDIEAGQIVTVAYDATANVWQMQSQTASTPGGGTVTSVGVTSSTLTVTGSPVTGAGDIDIEMPALQYPVQVVNTTLTSVATTTSTIPTDDTIPQIGEGLEIMTRAITPQSASNILRIDVVVNMAGVNSSLSAALFQDATANALAAGTSTTETAGAAFQQVIFTHYMVAGTTSATTFRVRAGGNSGGTATINGISSARVFGGVMSSSITITEYKA